MGTMVWCDIKYVSISYGAARKAESNFYVRIWDFYNMAWRVMVWLLWGCFFFVNGQLKITIRWLYMLIFITFKTVHSLPAGFTAIFTRSCYMVTSIRIFARLTTFVLTIWSIETNVTLCKEKRKYVDNREKCKIRDCWLYNVWISQFVDKRFYV